MKNIKINLKELRRSQELTQEELAKSLGISRQSIIAFETGKFLPSIELALQMADFFDTTIEDLIACEKKFHENSTSKQLDTSPKQSLDLWKSFGETDGFRQAMAKLVEDFLSDESKVKQASIFPKIEISQNDRQLIIRCEVPGVRAENIDVQINESQITIAGTREIGRQEIGYEYFKQEISYGNFSRTISFPYKIDKETTEAKFKDGILTIHADLMKSNQPKTKKLKIEVIK